MLSKLCPKCNGYMQAFENKWGWLKCSCGFAKEEAKVKQDVEVVSLKDYWMGRDATHFDEMTREIVENAKDLLKRVNALLNEIQVLKVKVNSGWRPPSINKAAGGSPNSKHLSGNAIDLDDDIARTLSDKITLELLEKHDLVMEHPDATHGPKGTWVHLQRLPVKSGKRIFYP